MKVIYIGHVGQPTGYGIAASHMCMALLSVGVDLVIVPIADDLMISPRFEPLRPHLWLKQEPLDVGDDVDAIITHTLPMDCARARAMFVGYRGGKEIHVVYTTWEGRNSPQFGFMAFDALWSPSAASRIGLLTKVSGLFDEGVPTADHPGYSAVIPHCYDAASVTEWGPKIRDFRTPYRFYYVGAWNARKNVAGLMRAYAAAFTAEDHVELVIHSPGVHPHMVAAIRASTGIEGDDGTFPAIRFSTEYVADEDLVELHAHGHCFVTASRGEGWNLGAFEAMLAGNHVIAPFGQGSDDFLLETSAFRYRTTTSWAYVDAAVKIVDGNRYTAEIIGAQGLTSRCQWLEPDLVELSKAMRWAYEANKTTIAIDYHPAERYGYEAVGQLALTKLRDYKEAACVG